MKRRLLSAFLAVMMVLTMAPVAFAADEGDTLQSKINNASDKVTLTKDYTEDITIPAGKTITLDLNGKTLTNASGNTITVEKEASLTIQGKGTVDNVTNGKTTVYNKGTVALKGGTYKRSAEDGVDANNAGTNTFYTVLNHGGMTINGGVTIENNGHHSSMLENGYYNGYAASLDGVSNPEMVINGGTFVGGLNTVKNDDNATLTINDGSFSNYTQATFQNHHVATINGGAFNAENVDAVINCGNASCTSTNEEHGKHFTQITGGIFNGGVMRSVGNIEITGGAFTENVSEYVATGYKSVELNGKNIVVADTDSTAAAELSGYKFTTVQNAINAAINSNTVKLLSNVTENITIADKGITLDLNGKTLTVPSDCGIDVSGKDSTLTITGDGVITCHETPICVSEGAVVIENGTINSETDYCTYAKDGGTITVNGGTLTSTNAVLFGNNTTGSMNFIVNGGTLTAREGPAIYQSGQCELTITGGMLNGGISLRMGQVNISGGTINATTGNIDSPTEYYNYSGNAWLPDALYVFGGTYDKGDAEHGNSLNLNITGGTFNCTNGQGSAIAIYDIGRVAQAAKITISGDAKLATTTSNRKAYDVLSLSDIGVTNPATGYGKTDLVGKVSTAISGGYFTTDPSAYCVTGKTGVASDKDGYKYKVGTVEVKDENEIKTDTQKGTTQATLSSEIAEKDKTAATDVGASVTPTKLTDTTPITETEKNEALTELVKTNKVELTEDGKIPENTTVTVVKETYLDVTVTAYDTTNNTVSMNIVPKYNLIAVAKTGADEKTVTLESAQDAKVGSTEVKVTLPDAFKGQKVYINHNNGANLYVATADATTGEITFTTNGFSPFTFALSNPNVVAEVNGNAYKTLQDAANAAKDGDEITVVKNANLDLTFNTTKSVKVTNKTDNKITVKFNGTNKDVAKDATETFSYTKPSGGSSGGSSSGQTTYKVTTSAVNNGGVNASPSSAEKGASITITLSPDKGYKLDKLTVTDGSGKTVSTVKKSDTVYTFTMPASAVNVGVSYVKADATPSETKFNDVFANDWFASAVDYVTGKGMMNGTADNTFSPKANTTRGMVVTVLYRLENQPSTSAASFTDVASGAYYANAVAWANANGIVSGYGSGKFGPNDKVTREQLAAILYRYAQYKKYDVSGANSLDGYADAQSVSSYAVPALQWANAAGVVTGKSGSKLDPKGNAARAEVAAMLMRFCENVK